MKEINEIAAPILDVWGLNVPIGPELTEVRDNAHRFANDVMRPMGVTLDRMSAEEMVAEGSPLWEYLEKVKASGLFNLGEILSMPDDQQCAALPVLCEEFGWGDVGLGLLGMATSFPTLAAQATGETELIQRFAGKIGCWVGTQPDRGSDVMDLTGMQMHPNTRPARGNLFVKKDGDDYIINGQSAAWVSAGPIASCGVLYAACDFGDGFFSDNGRLNYIGMLVPFDERGVSKGRPLEKLGQRPLPQGGIFFDAVRLPAKYVVSDRDQSHLGVYSTVTFANMEMGMMFVGVARAAYEHALRYAHERRQGGVPIIQHQSVRARIYSMWQKLETAHALSARVVRYNYSSNGPHSLASLTSKAFVTQAAFDVASEAVKIFGANGLAKEYPLEKLSRDAQTSLIEDGENTVLGLMGGSWLSRWYVERAT
jgi:alkylation response protein AidB-like acyl-CoA dehydrogenase